MDIITEILECCSTFEIDLFTSIKSVLPVDYFIPLIGHTFGVLWIVNNHLETFVNYQNSKQYNFNYRRGRQHTYDDCAPYIYNRINYRGDLEHFGHTWYKNGYTERTDNAANIDITRRTTDMKIVAIYISHRPDKKLSKYIEFHDEYRTRESTSRSGPDGFYIDIVKESKKPPRNNEEIKEWLWVKHKVHF